MKGFEIYTYMFMHVHTTKKNHIYTQTYVYIIYAYICINKLAHKCKIAELERQRSILASL